MTLVDVITLAAAGIVVSALTVGCVYSSAHEAGRQNTCRNNMRQLAMANIMFANKSSANELPGYIDVLVRNDGLAYHDGTTQRTEPVSWVVKILPELDRQAHYDEWRSGETPAEGRQIGSPPHDRTHLYLDFLICPSDPQPNRSGTPICYAVNTGIPDYPGNAGIDLPRHAPRTACRCEACGGKAVVDAAVPDAPARDLAANGVFFDRFTSSRHFDPKSRTRPTVASLDSIRDGTAKTILLTENVDSINYTLSAAAGEEAYAIAERELGVVWAPNSTFAAGQPPTIAPPADSYKINGDTGLGDGMSYAYSRPSSKHPGGVNMAFVGQNVQFMKDSLSYYVYVKLMTANDAGAATLDAQGNPVPLLAEFRTTPLTEAEISP
jgi:hypothetical protein